MSTRLTRSASILAISQLIVACASLAHAQAFWPFSMPEQRTIQVRQPHELCPAAVPHTPPPATVSRPGVALPPLALSLDEAIRLSLENTEVVRVLAGVAAQSSGRTIYDPAIANTRIDAAQARFDPTVNVQNNFLRTETPQGVFDALDPNGAVIGGVRNNAYQFQAGVAKVLPGGGTASMNASVRPSHNQPEVLALEPQSPSAVEFSLQQPLLQGGGFAVNRAPIVVARIDTERSYYQLKSAAQESARGVIEAYWSLVNARVNVWAREKQTEQGNLAFDRAQARQRVGLADAAEVSQAKVAAFNFKANLIAAQGNVLDREAALRNILGLPASHPAPITPLSPPSVERYAPQWESLVELACEQRPDIVELKLQLEIDEQRLLQANNQALPRVDALAMYRLNRLAGDTPTGAEIFSDPNQFHDWTLGLTYSTPLGKRQARSDLRQQEITQARTEALLDQQLHAATHELALEVRRLDQTYEQYLAFREVREAARQNLEQQLAEYRAGRTIFLNVLLAITDWGNAISSEAQSLTQYNIELANLEFATGTLLETHGITFQEEQYGSLGWLGRRRPNVCYPMRLPPTENDPRYPASTQPAESFFDLQDPAMRMTR